MQMQSRQFKIRHIDELPTLAATVLDFAGDLRVWSIEGEMAAGKTTFIKEVCACLGVADLVNSPTFSIVNTYQDGEQNPVYHFDFYRLNNLGEALDAGLPHYLDSDNFCFLEWASAVQPLLPIPRLHIDIEVTSPQGRLFTLTRLETAEQEKAALTTNA